MMIKIMKMLPVITQQLIILVKNNQLKKKKKNNNLNELTNFIFCVNLLILLIKKLSIDATIYLLLFLNLSNYRFRYVYLTICLQKLLFKSLNENRI